MQKYNPELCKELTKEDLADLLGLPMRIYATLTYASMTPEGEIVLYFSKNNQYKQVEYLRKLRAMVGREVFIHIDEGAWATTEDPEE